MEQHFDIEQIKQDVAEVLSYSQGFDSKLDGISSIIDDWLKNKQFFIEKMGGNLIYQCDEPVSFELDNEAKCDKLDHFANQVDEHYNNFPLSNFLSSLSVEDFYNNKTSKEYITYYKDVIIPKNYKVVKAFKFFEKDVDRLKQLQSEASRIIQENIISGYLCFSVHPLDYLSISENAHNWRSCHALDGEYRSGNMNYMVDDTTVVCYLRADKQAILPHFPDTIPWNSKKWRVLLFFSNNRNMVFAGRPYPFTAEKGIEIIRKQMLPTLGLGKWTDWKDTFLSSFKDERSQELYHFSKLIPIGDGFKRYSDVVRNGPNTCHFNDLLRSTCYSPLWAYKSMDSPWSGDNTGMTSDKTEVVVGKPCNCPVCGKGRIAYTESMTCPSCADKYGYYNNEDYIECEICGTMTHCDDIYELDYSGLRVCPECFAHETAICQECGVRDMPDVVKYRDGDSRCLCPDCWANSQHTPPERIIF